MRKYLIAAAILVASLGSNASAEVVFRGSMVLTAAANCKFEQKGFDYISQYHPRGLGNENFTGLVQVYTYGAAAYHLNNADFTSTFKNVEGVATSWSWYDFPAKIRVTSQVPATITTATPFISLRGQISNPWDDPGVGGQECIVTFDATYWRNHRDDAASPYGRAGR